MNRQERVKELEQQIASAVGELEAQMLEGTSEDFVKSLEWWSKFRAYSWNNSLLILLQRPTAIQMAGFRALEKLGFHVKQGEQATWIRGPVLKKVTDPNTGEIVQRLVAYVPLAVFCLSQTAEYPAKQPPNPYKPETTADWEALYEVWSRRLTTLYGIEVKELEMGALAYGAASGKSIWVNSRQDVSIKAMNLVHEICHIAAGHTVAAGHDKWSLQERELQVQAATFVLCRMVGVTHPNAANYLLQYKVEQGQLSDHLESIGTIVRDVRHMLEFTDLGKVAEHSQAA